MQNGGGPTEGGIRDQFLSHSELPEYWAPRENSLAGIWKRDDI